jgi:hypothetical protein
MGTPSSLKNVRKREVQEQPADDFSQLFRFGLKG